MKWQMIVKRWFIPYNKKYPITSASVVAVLVAIIFFTSGPFNRQGVFELLSQLLGSHKLNNKWQYISIYYSLSMFVITRTLTTAFATAIAVPAGDFIPQFLVGAAMGRIVGEGLDALFPSYGFSPSGKSYSINACCAAVF